MLRRVLTVILGVAIPMVAGAQGNGELPDANSLIEVEARSAAPHPFGWQLPPDDSGEWSSIDIGGVTYAFSIEEFFTNGLALGHGAAEVVYRDGVPLSEGMQFKVFLNGALAVGPKLDLMPSPDRLIEMRESRLVSANESIELFAPRMMAAEPYVAGEVCPDEDKDHAVFFYSTAVDANADPAAPSKMMITWLQIVTADNCEAEPATFQMVIEELPGQTAPRGRPPVRVTYRYLDCGEPVDQADFGPRTGMIYDGLGAGGPKRGFEVLGAREQMFGTANGGLIIEGRESGASGDPTRVLDYCRSTNLRVALEDGDVTQGVFSYVLSDFGRPQLDEDDDGVPDVVDNCVNTGNPYQENTDEDDNGDACDANVDGDRDDNDVDLCPFIHNAGRAHVDQDGDGLGDRCDDDIDGDQVANFSDNCASHFNPGQLDLDGDGKGTHCDLCDGEDCTEAELLVTLLDFIKGQHDVLFGAQQVHPSLSEEMLEAIRDFPTEAERAAAQASSTHTFIDVWAAKLKASMETTWAMIGELSHWSLQEGERFHYTDLVGQAQTTADAEQLQLFEDWANSKLSFGEFLNKYGLSYLKGNSE